MFRFVLTAKKNRFSKDEPLAFKDFTLTYIGDRQVSSQKSPNDYIFRDFKVHIGGGGERTVSWSKEIGAANDGAAMPFGVTGVQYELELEKSKKLGKLAADELVIRAENSRF